jgi:hypothetical protein
VSLLALAGLNRLGGWRFGWLPADSGLLANSAILIPLRNPGRKKKLFKIK